MSVKTGLIAELKRIFETVEPPAAKHLVFGSAKTSFRFGIFCTGQSALPLKHAVEAPTPNSKNTKAGVPHSP